MPACRQPLRHHLTSQFPRDAARAAARAARACRILATLQNGIGSIEALVQNWVRRVVAGVIMNSAANQPGQRCTPTPGSPRSCWTADHPRIESGRIEPGGDRNASSRTRGYIWSRIRAELRTINPLRGDADCAAARCTTPEVNALQDRVIDEILAVVERKGVKLAEANPRKKIKEHCRIRYNRPSMMQHMEQGRRTEIDALNGALVREAKALGIPVPYNEAVVAMVKGMEKSRRQLLHEAPRDYAKLETEAAAEARAAADAGGATHAG
jgi:2-dehydropantoate 2-reductase